MDPKARRYRPEGFVGGRRAARDSSRSSLQSLGLGVGETFLFWFDFGDDWWHGVEVLAVEEAEPGRKYPRVTKRVGASPPQAPDLDDEDDDREEE